MITGCKLLTERETFDCFPFLCPFYPWGITNSDSKSSGILVIYIEKTQP